MRTLMRESEKFDTDKLEESREHLTERAEYADKLVEKWSKKKGIGDGLQEAFDSNPEKVRSTAIILENQEKGLKKMTETQISTAFSTTPENVMKIVRIGYPNSIRGEIFMEWAMQTSRDSIYYLYPQYASTKRDATAAARTIESSAYRYATEIEQEDCLTAGDGSSVTFTGTLSKLPVVPYSIRVLVNNVMVGNDNGAGVFPSTTGGDLVTGATPAISTGTVNYTTTGNYSITFSTAPAASATVTLQYNYNSEDSTEYTNLGFIELQLRDYQFRVRPYPLGVSWSKMTELLLGTTLNIDAEEALIRGAADELKKSLDFQACRLGYFAAKGNTVTTFDAAPGSAGEDSTVERAQAITNAFDRAADVMYNALQRGGVSKVYGGPNATSYLKLHKRFDGSGKQPAIGGYKIGSLDGIDIFKLPSAIVPNNELVVVYKNEQIPEDVSIAFGTLIPLYKTQKLEFKNLYSEQGIAHFGDAKILQNRYLARISISNLPLL